MTLDQRLFNPDNSYFKYLAAECNTTRCLTQNMFILPEASRLHRHCSSFRVSKRGDLAQHTLVNRDNPDTMTTTKVASFYRISWQNETSFHIGISSGMFDK